MDDHEVVAAIVAGSPAGIAVAYDRYAAALYGYCRWMLSQPSEAAKAVRDTFVIATSTLSGLTEAPRLRPWLYSIARKECERRLQTRSPTDGRKADEADYLAHPAQQGEVAYRSADAAVRSYPVSAPTDAAGSLTGAIDNPDRAELQTLIRAILAELKPRDREVIELNLRHDLYGADLAVVLGVSWSHANVLASRARARLEKALGTLLIARTGRTACPALETLLTDWDGHLTDETRRLVGAHIEQCKTCAGHRQGTLRPAAFSELLPLAMPPFHLKEQVLQACAATTPDAVAYYRRPIWHADSMWPTRLFHAIRLPRWRSIRARHRPATATVVLVGWIVAVWAVAALIFIFTGSHLPGLN
jgi:RNA polymerase sigma factor (sigma-70 family)